VSYKALPQIDRAATILIAPKRNPELWTIPKFGMTVIFPIITK